MVTHRDDADSQLLGNISIALPLHTAQLKNVATTVWQLRNGILNHFFQVFRDQLPKGWSSLCKYLVAGENMIDCCDIVCSCLRPSVFR